MRTLLSTLFLVSLPLKADVIDLGTLGGDYSFARDINESGTVAGEAHDADGRTRAFLWEDGSMIALGNLPGMGFSMANGLNNRNEAVGYARSATGSGQSKAVLWDASGRATSLPHLSGQSYSQASDLNDKGDVAGVSGTQAVVWTQKKAKALPSLGGDYSIALGISQSGWVVGNSLTKEGAVHASLWREGRVIDLGTLGGRFSTANAINDSHQIVGSSETATGEIHAFLWESGTMHDLGPGMIRNVSPNAHLAGERPRDELGREDSLGVIWDDSRRPLVLEQLERVVYSSAFGINSQGLTVGVSELKSLSSSPQQDAGYFRATLWRP